MIVCFGLINMQTFLTLFFEQEDLFLSGRSFLPAYSFGQMISHSINLEWCVPPLTEEFQHPHSFMDACICFMIQLSVLWNSFLNIIQPTILQIYPTKFGISCYFARHLGHLKLISTPNQLHPLIGLRQRYASHNTSYLCWLINLPIYISLNAHHICTLWPLLSPTHSSLYLVLSHLYPSNSNFRTANLTMLPITITDRSLMVDFTHFSFGKVIKQLEMLVLAWKQVGVSNNGWHNGNQLTQTNHIGPLVVFTSHPMMALGHKIASLMNCVLFVLSTYAHIFESPQISGNYCYFYIGPSCIKYIFVNDMVILFLQSFSTINRHTKFC